MKHPAQALIIVAALFISVIILHPVWAQTTAQFGGLDVKCDVDQFADLNYDGGPLDLEGCQQYCRSIYGVDLYWWGGGGSGYGRGIGYATCIQKCNTRYWKAWDKDMKNLGK